MSEQRYPMIIGKRQTKRALGAHFRAALFSGAMYILLCAVAASTLGVAVGCRVSNKESSAGVVAVNAPAAGVVRRVLVSEGGAVDQGAVIIEITVQPEQQPPFRPGIESSREKAQTSARTAQSDVSAAEAEANRTAVEVQRVGQLVASGAASQSELDAASAQYQHAQERLQSAREGVRRTQDILVAQESPQLSATRAAPTERTVPVRAPAAGRVAVISAQVGQRVTTGEPLATVVIRK